MTDFNAPGRNPEGRNIAVDKNEMASIMDLGLRTQDSGLRTRLAYCLFAVKGILRILH